jgi:hypothetical protein
MVKATFINTQQDRRGHSSPHGLDFFLLLNDPHQRHPLDSSSSSSSSSSAHLFHPRIRFIAFLFLDFPLLACGVP